MEQQTPDRFPEPSGNVSYHVAQKKGNGCVIALFVTALVLLAIAVVGCILIVNRSAVIINGHDGVSVITGEDDDPFALAQTTAATTTSAAVDINDPPEALSTTSVENDGTLTTTEIAKRVRPSVVSVLAANSRKSVLGSGIIMTPDGLIVTNYHVISGMTQLSVVLHNGAEYDAVVVGSDDSSDLAVLKIDAAGLTPAVFGNSDALEVGDPAVAIGTPYSISLSGTTTQGIISAIDRDVVINNRTLTLIQTDATVNPGNSGGPLVNKYGQVVGIVSLKIAEDFEGLGFAIPMNSAKPILEELVSTGHISGTPALGISGRFLSEMTAAVNRLPVGLYITHVSAASDAYAKGLRVGDVIVAIDGAPLTDLAGYTAMKNAHRVGDTVKLKVFRDNGYTYGYAELDVVLMDENALTN